MNTTPKHTTILPLILLILLAFIWGASFFLIKKGLTVFSPIQVMAVRAFIAAMLLLPLAVKAFRNIPRHKWKHIVVLGMIGNLLPAYLFAKAETQVSSSMAGILNALTPIFTLLVGVMLFKLRMVWTQVLGVCIGFIGTAFVVYTGAQGEFGMMNWYAVFVVLATICYSISTNTLKYYFDAQAVADVTVAQISVIGLPSFVILLCSDLPTVAQQEGFLEALGYLAILAVFGTIIGMWIFNKITQLKSAVFAISVTYLIPFVAVFIGLINQEQIYLGYWIGLLLIVSGVFFINK